MNLAEAARRWPNSEAAMAHLEKVRWNGHVICPYCKSEKTCVHASKDKKLPRWQCESCHRAFSATVGTIFHHTHLPLSTWFLAIVVMLSAKKNVSNAQLGRDLGLPYKTAWSLALRIRQAMMSDPEQMRLFHSIVEMDETYAGGKARKGNNGPNGGGGGASSKRRRGAKKMEVGAFVERNGHAQARALPKSELRFDGSEEFFERIADRNSPIVFTDEYGVYKHCDQFVRRFAVNYKRLYVSGASQTNKAEGFWALAKRSYHGQRRFYSEKRARPYISETAFKYFLCKRGDEFGCLLRHMVGTSA